MHKMLAAFSLALLVGCSISLEDRLDEGPRISLTTNKSPKEFVNCIQGEWALTGFWGTPDILTIDNGVRYLQASTFVEVILDAVDEGEGTYVDMYYRNVWHRHRNKFKADLENCS